MDEPAREHDVRHVPGSFVRLERTEDPRGESTKDPGRLVKVEQQRLYTLATLKRKGAHELDLRFDPGIKGYAFTFG
jgi:hypothetical protein